MIKALFFDFDGTISDAYGIAAKSLCKTLDEFGYRFNRNHISKLLGEKLEVVAKEIGLNLGHLDAMRKKFYSYFIGEAKKGNIKLCTSVKPLWELKKKYPLIVISNSETRFIKISIRKLGVEGLFDEIYGAEKFRLKDDILKKLFKKMKIKPEEAIYVGDRFSDIEYARSAGCYAIAIHNKCSWSNLKTIKKENPDFIIKNFSELKKLIKKIDEGVAKKR